MSKKQINLFVGSIGAFIGVFVFIAYIPQIKSLKRTGFSLFQILLV